MNIASIIANCFFSFPLFFFLFKLFFYLKMSFLSKLFGGGGQQQRGKTTVRTQRTVQQQQTKKRCASLITQLETFLEEKVVGCSDFTKGEFIVNYEETVSLAIVKGIRFKYSKLNQSDFPNFIGYIYPHFLKQRTRSIRYKICVHSEVDKKFYDHLIQQFKTQCSFEPFFVIDPSDNNNDFVIFVYEKVGQTTRVPRPPQSTLLHASGGGGGGGGLQQNKTTVRTQRTVGQTIRVPRPPQSTLLHASGGGGGGRKQQTKKCASLIVELETFLKSVVGCSDFTIGHFDVTGSDGLTGAPSKVKGIRFKCDTPRTSISLDKIYVCITKPTSVRKYIYVDLMEKKTNYNYLIQQFEEHCLFKPFFVIDRDDRNFVILVYYIIEK